MPIEQNPHIVAAYSNYMNALKMVRCGLLGNASAQREHLRTLYRIVAGKKTPMASVSIAEAV